MLDSTVQDDLAHQLDALRVKLSDDPWSLTGGERQTLKRAYADAQTEWQERLPQLVEPPAVDDSFPAFLLGTERFAYLARDVGPAATQTELSTATADELQRFVDRYRSYMSNG